MLNHNYDETAICPNTADSNDRVKTHKYYIQYTAKNDIILVVYFLFILWQFICAKFIENKRMGAGECSGNSAVEGNLRFHSKIDFSGFFYWGD